VEAAYLHVLGDMLNSVGVIVAATVVYIWPEYWIIDPLCTYFFAIIVLVSTRLTFWSCIKLLLETTPDHVDISIIREAL
jgi:solute carrier family 30 (zinc transporter), member 2